MKQPHFAALLTKLRAGKLRSKPTALVASLLKKKLPADLKSFLEVCATHVVPFISVGELWLDEKILGGRVPDANDDDRQDAICIGNTGGGDLWVIENPPKGRVVRILRLYHEENFSEIECHHGFELFLQACVEESWGKQDRTDLDDELERAGLVSPMREAERKKRTAEDMGNRNGGFQLVTTSAHAKPPSVATAKLFEKGTTPRAVGGYFVGWDHDAQLAIIDDKSRRRLDSGVTAYWFDGSRDGKRVLATGRDGIFEIDLAKRKARLLSKARPFYAASYVGDRIAAICFDGNINRMLLRWYRRDGDRLVADGKSVRCDGMKKLRALAGDRLLVVYMDDKAAPCHFVGVRNRELRALGTARGIDDVWESDPDGRVCAVTVDKRVLELRDLDALYDRAFAGPKRELILT